MGIAELKARQEGRKRAGLRQTYPQHAGRVRGAASRTPLPVLAVCVHGGTDADILEHCWSCGGGGRHVRECEVHGRCTHEPVNPAVMNCWRCQGEGLGFAPVSV